MRRRALHLALGMALPPAALAPVWRVWAAQAAGVDPLPAVARALAHVRSYQVTITLSGSPACRALPPLPRTQCWAITTTGGSGGRRGDDVRRLRDVLTAAGVQVPANTARVVHGGRLAIAGVDDPASARAHVPATACRLPLAHTPDVALHLGARRPALILAGHTHGGQVRRPLVGAFVTRSRLPRRLAMGRHRYRGVPLFVSRGSGYSGLNLRLQCPAEVALLTLRRPRPERAPREGAGPRRKPAGA